jgi:hypothetical protein
MGRSYTQRVSSKWAKTRVLLKSRKLRWFVPKTRFLNRKSLSSMLKRYGMVYIKPNVGSLGVGVAKLERLTRKGRSFYCLRWAARKRYFYSFPAMYRMVRKISLRRTYLVQQGIHVLRYRNRPFDLRVMVQFSPRRRWETTGIIGRIAPPNKIVTNRRAGGSIMKAESLLARHVNGIRKRRLIRRLRWLGVQTSRHMKKSYPRMKELGLDVALNRKLHPWILEVNTTPVVKLFNQLRDKRMIRKIVRYGRAYGRKFNNLR